MLNAVVASLDPAEASPQLLAAASHVLAAVTSSSGRAGQPPNPETLLPMMKAAVGDIYAVIPRPEEGTRMIIRPAAEHRRRRWRASGGEQRGGSGGYGIGRRTTGGPEVYQKLRRKEETHWRVHEHLIQDEVDEVGPGGTGLEGHKGASMMFRK
jgi:hypothetical protein